MNASINDTYKWVAATKPFNGQYYIYKVPEPYTADSTTIMSTCQGGGV